MCLVPFSYCIRIRCCRNALPGNRHAFYCSRTAWCSEIGFLKSLDAPEFHASSDVREPISLHQAVHGAHLSWTVCQIQNFINAHFWQFCTLASQKEWLSLSFAVTWTSTHRGQRLVRGSTFELAETDYRNLFRLCYRAVAWNCSLDKVETVNVLISSFFFVRKLEASIDHLHNYGPGTRFGASQARFGCVVCVSHWSFRFSSALECRSAITVVFLAFSIEAGLVLHSSLMVFHGQVNSGSAGYLPFVRLTGRTSASPTTRWYALSTSSLQQIFAFMLVPKSLWTLPSPVLWHRVRLDTSWKQVQCHRSFLFTRMGPKWEYEARRRRESDMFAPAVVWAKCWGHSLSEAGRKEGEEVAMQVKFVPGGFFFCCFMLHLEKHRGCARNAVCMRDDDWEILGVQEARLSRTANDCVLFFSRVLSQTSDAPTWVSRSRVQIKTRRIALWTVTETPEVRGVYCGRWRCMDTYHSRNSAFFPFHCGLFFF